MSSNSWFSPYDTQRRIGSVISISPTEVTVNLTNAGLGESTWVFGTRMTAGEVSEFVFIDVGHAAILGRLVKVWLDGGERISVDDLIKKPTENHPLGIVQLLTSIEVSDGFNHIGINQYPRLGSQVYSAHPKLIAKIAENESNDENKIKLPIAHLPNNDSVKVRVTPEKLFSRHCAILGATGGGKSYSIAKILEEVDKSNGKAIIIDATGEYKDLPCKTYYVGENPLANKENKVTFPHWCFTDGDIHAMLRPSALTQAPKLEAAILSQKIAFNFYNESEIEIDDNGIVWKAGNPKERFNQAVNELELKQNKDIWVFKNLIDQVVQECIWPTNFNNDSNWGVANQNEIGHCISLISRIKSYSENKYLKCIIDVDEDLLTIPEVIDEFCLDKSDETNILRLDLSCVPFEANAREILVNAIGRKLLSISRDGQIRMDSPLLVFIDEAHQFLNKRLGDEFNRFELDAFGNIAKEGRKFGLNVVIATQRPRDIPEDVLSQIGTIIVHRLTNHMDQEIVRKAVGSIDQRSLSFLPTLGQGEALLLGVDFPFPMMVKIELPKYEPDSKSAAYSESWLKRSE